MNGINSYTITIRDGAGISDDYAYMNSAEWDFYFGYEYLVDESKPADDPNNWKFIAKNRGQEVMTIPG